MARDVFIEKGHAPFVMLREIKISDYDRFDWHQLSVVSVVVDDADGSIVEICGIEPFTGETPSTEYFDGGIYFCRKRENGPDSRME